MKSKGIGNLKSKGIGGYIGSIALGRFYIGSNPIPNGRAVLNKNGKNTGRTASKKLSPRKSEHNK